jgi:hypothetical protein
MTRSQLPRSQTRPAWRSEGTAYHGARHVVAAYAAGRPFTYVTIKPKRDGEGWVLGRVYSGEGTSYLDAPTWKRQREIARAVVLVTDQYPPFRLAP